MTRDVDDFLDDADDVIDDWEWSGDAASWSADGSHEYDTDGNYYLSRPRLGHGYVSRPPEMRRSGSRGYEPSFLIHDEAQSFVAPRDSPLPSASESYYQVKIEVTSPDGAVVEFMVRHAAVTLDVQRDEDRFNPLRFAPPVNRVQFVVEAVDGCYERHDQRSA